MRAVDGTARDHEFVVGQVKVFFAARAGDFEEALGKVDIDRAVDLRRKRTSVSEPPTNTLAGEAATECAEQKPTVALQPCMSEQNDSPTLQEMACHTSNHLSQRLDQTPYFDRTDSRRGCSTNTRVVFLSARRENLPRPPAGCLFLGARKKRTEERVEEEVVFGRDQGDVPELGIQVFEDADRLWAVAAWAQVRKPVFRKEEKEERGEVSLLPVQAQRQDPKTGSVQPIHLRR